MASKRKIGVRKNEICVKQTWFHIRIFTIASEIDLPMDGNEENKEVCRFPVFLKLEDEERVQKDAVSFRKSKTLTRKCTQERSEHPPRWRGSDWPDKAFKLGQNNILQMVVLPDFAF